MARFPGRLKNGYNPPEVGFFTPTDIYTSQRLMLFTLKFAGLFPFKIAESKKDNRNKVIERLWFLAVCLLFIFDFKYAFSYALAGPTNDSGAGLLRRFARVIRFINMVALITIIYCSCFCLSESIISCMRHIVHIDRKLKLIGAEINYWEGFHHSILLICFVAVNFATSFSEVFVSTALESAEEKHRPTTLSAWLSFLAINLPLMTMALIECFHASIAFEIRKRFEAMNRMLQRMYDPESIDAFESNESMTWNVRNKSQMFDFVEDLCKIHSDLCDTCAIASDYFGLKMASVFGTSFLNLLLNGYFIFVRVFNDRKKQTLANIDYSIIAYNINETIMTIVGMIIACNSCYEIYKQNDKASIYVHKILNSTTNQLTKNKLLEFSLQLWHRNIKFSALSFFSLNRKLLFLVIEGVTTYLIILIEFSTDS